MNPNRYFIATLVSSAVILVGLAVMLIKSSPALYQQVLQLCGLSWQACAMVVSDINPLSIIITGIFVWLVTIFIWQFLKTKFLLSRITKRNFTVPQYLMRISLRAGTGSHIRVIEGTSLFVAGLLRPRVYIGHEIALHLSDQELSAALAHESYHLRNFDPLKVWIVTSLARGLFFIPVISLFARSYLQRKELAADILAEAHTGSAHLSKALYKVVRASTDSMNGQLVPSLSSPRMILAEPMVQGGIYWIVAVSVITMSFLISGLLHPTFAQGACR